MAGSFTTLASAARPGLGAVDTITGAALSWNPNPNSYVGSIAASGTHVYLGGGFTSVGGQTRLHVADVDATTGVASSWNPVSDYAAYDIQAVGNHVYLGGAFFNIGGGFHEGFAVISSAVNATQNISKTEPIITISGKKSVATTKSKLKIKGSASVADGNIALVQVKVGKSGAKSALGTTNWSYTAKLAPGKNTIIVTATGSNGLISAPAKLTITRKRS